MVWRVPSSQSTVLDEAEPMRRAGGGDAQEAAGAMASSVGGCCWKGAWERGDGPVSPDLEVGRLVSREDWKETPTVPDTLRPSLFSTSIYQLRGRWIVT